ncbi:MAG: DUF1566 domain-containing protein, partial [Methylococcales bacterium]
LYLQTSLPATLSILVLLCAALPAHAAKNSKPIANAGADQNAVLAGSVNLNGILSSDSDGQVVKYQWRQSLGPKVKLFAANSATPSFLSPAKLKKNTSSVKLVFKLTVTDNKKAKSSDTVTVTVTAAPICFLPKILQNNVCITPAPTCSAPKVLKNNSCVLVCAAGQITENDRCVDPAPVCKDTEILRGGICINPTPVCIAPQVLQYNQCVLADSINKLNDTGMTTCSDGTEGAGSRSGCANGRYPGQDAEFGRDIYLNNDQDGHAGFSFTKISSTGTALPAQASEWACVKDNVTGLIWEVKTDDGGIRDKDLGYSYYNTSFNPKNEYASATDVTGFTNAVNQAGLCGAHDWRLPSQQELLSIVDYSRPLPGPAIDVNYFPNNHINMNGSYPFNSHYWTSSPYPRADEKAWTVLFADGSVYDDDRQRPGGAAIRLVRGAVAGDSNNRYTLSEDGQEVTDTLTGLIWRRCVEGMHWNGSSCAGQENGYMFEEALQQASLQASSTGKNWRLPNTKELASLIDPTRTDLLINADVFPNTPNFQSWTASGYIQDGFFAWMVNFYYGWMYFSYTEDTGTVRLVRDGG